MKLSVLISLSSAVLAAAADSSAFKWSSCPGKDEVNWKCGALPVPLDYSNSTSRKIEIAAAVYKAQVLPSLGTIVFNYGGPGAPGKMIHLSSAEYLSYVTGGRYDILGFDPRGAGESAPIVCFKSALHHAYYNAQSALLTSPFIGGSTTSLEAYAATKESLAHGCGDYSKDILPFLGTMNTARDMDEIRKALGEDVLNYYGFSYGTSLGVVYANMFPSKLGRAVIDGVMNVEAYMTGPLFNMQDDTSDLDELVDAFGRECDKAGPAACPLARAGEKTARRVRQFLRTLESAPQSVKGGAVPGVLGAPAAAKALYLALASPAALWPSFAAALAAAMGGSPQALFAQGLAQTNLDACPAADESGFEAFYAVACLDSTGNDADFKTWKAAAKKVDKVSFIAQNMFWQYLPCKYWQAKTERFKGPWNQKLKNKLLIIGNTLDPITPLRHAKEVERIMGGNGVVLQHEGYGHMSIAQPSSCTTGHIQQFFTNGTYPEKGTKCKSDGIPPFPGASPLKTAAGEKSGAELLQSLIIKYNVF
ncbi:TAP-like protein-domain-containing protein [Obelidium mucronatum]|nr:TAP-like protein-domain-containing protein [Obelidium mucronatum]